MTAIAQNDSVDQLAVSAAGSGRAQVDAGTAPTGPAAAALLAGGIGCAAFGLAVVLTESTPVIKEAMTLSAQVGPLSGKATAGIVSFVLAWLVLHLALGRRNLDLRRVITWTGGLTVVGVLGTFPPIYGLFAAGH